MDAGRQLAEAQDEQARAAEVVLNPDTALDDDAKGKGLKGWFKETKEKIGRRLSRSTPASPKQETGKQEEEKEEEEEEEEDLYGEPPQTSSNWRETPVTPREDSLRNVALAKPHDDAAAVEETHLDKGKELEEETHEETPATVHEPAAEEESEGEEKFDDAKDSFAEEPASTSLAVPEEEVRRVSSERGSRFKEEF
jgi:hypothetical protein